MRLRAHKSRLRPFRNRHGFTLVEIIATLTLSAVLIAMMLPLIGSSLRGSRQALLGLPKTHSLRTEMDAIWQSYRTAEPTDLPALSAAIATSADSAPYQLIDNAWVDFDDNGVEFIAPSGTEKVLRVTLGNSEGERLTSYFFPIP